MKGEFGPSETTRVGEMRKREEKRGKEEEKPKKG